MNRKANSTKESLSKMSPLFVKDVFSRPDERDDATFYSKDRFVNHLDTLALDTVEKLIGELVVEENPVILDLMAGWDSHIPEKLRSSKVVGLGLNKNELSQNRSLSEVVIHDLNKNPTLPFPDQSFDVVINTISVDYMTKPLQVFDEVGRILKPGGLFLVIFSNRMFPEKAVKVWQESSEDERVLLVEDFFKATESFKKPFVFLSKGKPRPEGDVYSHLGLPSDPIYAVYADKKGGSPCKARPLVTVAFGEVLEGHELEKRKQNIKKSMRCPYCGEKLRKWEVPSNPFACTWDNDFMYICFNDGCPYYVRGWDVMYKDGNAGVSYRLMYNPEKDRCLPVPVPTPNALKEGIVD